MGAQIGMRPSSEAELRSPSGQQQQPQPPPPLPSQAVGISGSSRGVGVGAGVERVDMIELPAYELELHECIGAGAAGQVYKAVWLGGGGIEVAVKRVRIDIPLSPLQWAGNAVGSGGASEAEAEAMGMGMNMGMGMEMGLEEEEKHVVLFLDDQTMDQVGLGSTRVRFEWPS